MLSSDLYAISIDSTIRSYFFRISIYLFKKKRKEFEWEEENLRKCTTRFGKSIFYLLFFPFWEMENEFFDLLAVSQFDEIGRVQIVRTQIQWTEA